MKYHGTEIEPRIGDTVCFESEGDLLTVEEVIDSEEKMKHWGLDQFGLMLTGGMYGLVFIQEEDPELIFLSHQTKSQLLDQPNPPTSGPVD